MAGTTGTQGRLKAARACTHKRGHRPNVRFRSNCGHGPPLRSDHLAAFDPQETLAEWKSRNAAVSCRFEVCRPQHAVRSSGCTPTGRVPPGLARSTGCQGRETVFRHACKLGLVSKRKDSPYRSGLGYDQRFFLLAFPSLTALPSNEVTHAVSSSTLRAGRPCAPSKTARSFSACRSRYWCSKRSANICPIQSRVGSSVAPSQLSVRPGVLSP